MSNWQQIAEKRWRGAILADDHLRGKQQLRTDYSEFEVPTIQRRWVERARASRRKA